MKIDRSWRGWRPIERGVLLTICVSCTFVAAQPLRERLVAWQNQHALRTQWQQQLAHRSDKKPHLSPTKTKGSLHASLASAQNSDGAEDSLPILWPMSRLTSSRIGLDAVVVEGTDEEQLKRGPGHEATTSYPGGPNCVIAAHRNAYGYWFYRLNDLKPGDTVVLQAPGCKYTYRVATSRHVSVRDTSILRLPINAAPRLTLYTCTLPKTESRLVVVANLQKSHPHRTTL